MFTSESTVGGGDIESGSITPEVLAMTRKASQLDTPLEKMEGDTNNIGQVEDLDKWVASLEKILNDVPPYMCNRGHPGRISRIPQNLRDVDVKGYEPSIMSIGPYHNGKPRMQQVEMRKKLVLKCVLGKKAEHTLKDFLKVVASQEPTIRGFYSDIEMESEEFVQMLLLDSVYLVVMFCGMPELQRTMNENKTRIVSGVESEDVDEVGKKKNEEGIVEDSANLNVLVAPDESKDEIIELKSGEHWYWTYFAHDLFLLENQVPFFLLQEIFNLAYAGSETEFIDIVKGSFVYMLADYTQLYPEMVTSRTEEVHHLLHLCHMFFRPTIQHDSIVCNFPESSQMFRLGSAMQLYEAGIHFEARPEYSLLDVTFDSSGKMGLPCLHVDDNTESLLRNLIALEQMKYPSVGLNISAYVVLLLHLITTPKDVELLRRKGIVQHHLASDKEMMYLVNRLSTGLAFDYVEDQYSLKPVFRSLKHYSERRVPRWRAWLKHRHFSNPWTVISLFVTFLFVLLTALQTYYAVYSYYYPCCDGHS